MSNGDRMSLAEGAHVAGMALLLAFAAAFILSSARAAKPVETQPLSEIVTALAQASAAGAMPWRDLEARLRARWSEAPPGARPPGLENASVVRTAVISWRLPGEGSAKRRTDNWQITAWGSPRSPDAVRVRHAGPNGTAEDLELALRTSGVPFIIECETDSVRHYRLAGRSAASAAQYTASDGQPEILFFLQAAPEALLRRDGCLLASAPR